MKIAVFVKQVPDSAAKLTVENGVVNWGDAPLVINPWDEYAVEAALLLAEKHNGQVTAYSLGDENAKEALKHALAMGCQQAVLIADPALAKADTAAVARTLAAAAQKDGAELAVFGKQAIDWDSGVTPAMTARVLGWPALSLVAAIPAMDPGAKTIKVERAIEEGRQVVESQLPAALSIVKDFAEPRYPSFMGIRKAAQAQIPTWTLADLGMAAPANAVETLELSAPPAREVSNEIISGDSPADVAAKLVDKIIGEGVL